MKKLPITILGLLVLTSLFFIQGEVLVSDLESDSENFSPSLFSSLALTSRGAIEIASDDDFTSDNGVIEGDGEKLTPFIISGWNITATDIIGIHIHDTTKYFEISNNFISFSGSTNLQGIYIDTTAVETATIESNIVLNFYHGIYITYSTNATIVNNTIYDVAHGLYVTYSHNSTFMDNKIESTSGYGSYFQGSTYIDLINNTFDDTQEAIYLHGSSFYGNVINNTVINNYKGIWLSASNFTISNNIINNNTLNGIDNSGQNTTILGNEINDNKKGGIYTSTRSNLTIKNNILQNNGAYGISLFEITNLVLVNNSLSNCEIRVNYASVSSHVDALIDNNIVNGLPFGWLINQHDTTISDAYGQIYLINSSNVIIENQIFSNMQLHPVVIKFSNNSILRDSSFSFMYDALAVSDSYNFEISNNKFLNISNDAIIMDTSPGAIITDNEFNYVEGNYAIYLSGGSDSIIKNNILTNFIGYEGINLDSSNNMFIFNNTIYNIEQDGTGIYTNGGNNITITSNVIKNSLETGLNGYGIDLDSTNVTIKDNFIKHYENGIIGEPDSGFVLIEGNIFVGSEEYGIFAQGYNYSIHHNFFINNYLDTSSGIFNQTFDDGKNNTWYDTSISEGNYWDDWSGTGAYLMDGPASDPYPLHFSLSVVNSFISTAELGSSNNIDWTVTSSLPISEELPVEYIVFENGTEVVSGSLTDSNVFSYSFDNSANGIYNYTIIITDYLNKTVIDTVFITVSDSTNPIINSLGNITYEGGSTGNVIIWTAIDFDAGNYTIYQNNVELFTLTWVSGAVFGIDIDGLAIGTYNYTVVVRDHSGNFVTDEVIVTVRDTTDPIFNSPADITYIVGETGNNLSLTATDLYAGNYTLYQNGVDILSDDWTSGTTIDVVVDGLAVGTYNYTIIIRDQSGNFVIDTVIITVTESADTTDTTDTTNTTDTTDTIITDSIDLSTGTNAAGFTEFGIIFIAGVLIALSRTNVFNLKKRK